MKGSVRKRGDKWSYYFTIGKVDGKYKKKEKGGFSTKKEAEAALREAIRKFETEGHITQSNDYTLTEFINYWFDNVGSAYLKYESMTQYKGVLKNHINNEIGYLPLNKVTPIILQEFFTKKQKEFNCNANTNTVKVIKNLLNNVFKFAKKQNIITLNPMLHLELKSKKETTKKELRVISPEALKAMEAAIKDTRYYIPFLIALHTGVRRGEVLCLTWDNIDFENNRMHIEKALQQQKGKGAVVVGTKTKSSLRDFKMTNVLIEELKKHKEIQNQQKEYYGDHYYKEYDFVCCNEDGSPISPLRFSNFFISLSKRLGYQHSFHDLRHTHATLLHEAGVNVKVIQERLGHSDIATTMNIYSHITKSLEEDAIDRLNKKFDS